MKIRHNDIEIAKDDPFSNCKLDRKRYAEVLTRIVSIYADGFVLAINNEWGTGKTTFVKMWEQQLKNDNYKTLYFNAWETDFEDNPLVALIAEFKRLTNSKDNEKFKSILKKGAVLAKNITPRLVKNLAESNLVTKVIADAVEDIAKGGAEILEDEINKYEKKKDGIKEFKNCLQEYVDSIENNKPIIFIIDELDRCRPNYSVTLLEQVKHLFSVSGIIFVLAIDKEQLGNAVRGVYGSDRINANEYLRRFIDLEYSIPHPDTQTFTTYLYQYFGFDEILSSEQRKKIQQFRYDPGSLIELGTILFEKANLTLRQQEKIFSHARIGLQSLAWNQYLFPTVFLFLIFLKNHYQLVYQQIQKKNYDVQGLIDEFSKIFPKGLNEHNLIIVIQLEALLTHLYHNYFFDGIRGSLIEKDETTGSEHIIITSRMDKSEKQFQFDRYIKSFIQDWDYRDASIKFILNKIDLIQKVDI